MASAKMRHRSKTLTLSIPYVVTGGAESFSDSLAYPLQQLLRSRMCKREAYSRVNSSMRFSAVINLFPFAIR